MLVIWICIAIPNLNKLYMMKNEFEHVSYKLRADKEYVDGIAKYLLGQTDEFQSGFFTLKDRFLQYADEIRYVAKFKSIQFVDINDFFNTEYIDKLTGASLCNLIPGAMTGLGILGTFMGLVAGIAGFSTKNPEAISTGIDTLLGGMNTAFLTSIAGVISSLLFSFIYKSLYGSCIIEMENFITVFCRANLDNSNKSFENQLLFNEKLQVKILNVFSSDICKSISDTMKTELVPVFDSMRQTTQDFVNFASAQQKSSLEKIVQEFVKNMNEALYGQFKELGQEVKSFYTQMKDILNHIDTMSKNVADVNITSRQIITEMNGFIAKFDDIKTAVNEQVRLAGEQINKSISASNEQIEAMLQMTSNVKDEVAAVEKSVSIIRQYCQDRIEDVSKSTCEQISKFVDSANNELRSFKEISSQLLEFSKVSVEQAKEFASQAKNSTDSCCQNMSDISQRTQDSVSKATSAMIEQTKAITESINQHYKEQISNVLNESAKQIEQSHNCAQESLQSTNQHCLNEMTTVSKNSCQQVSEFISIANDELKSFKEISNQLLEFSKVSLEHSSAIAKQAEASAADCRQQMLDISQKSQSLVTSLVEAVNECSGNTIDTKNSKIKKSDRFTGK